MICIVLILPLISDSFSLLSKLLGTVPSFWKSKIILWVSFSCTDSSFFLYHLLVCSNFNLLHNSQWITPPPSHASSCIIIIIIIIYFFKGYLLWPLSSMLSHILFFKFIIIKHIANKWFRGSTIWLVFNGYMITQYCLSVQLLHHVYDAYQPLQPCQQCLKSLSMH